MQRCGRGNHKKVYPRQLGRLKEWENSINTNQSPNFLKLPKRNGANHLIFQLEFPVFPCKW